MRKLPVRSIVVLFLYLLSVGSMYAQGTDPAIVKIILSQTLSALGGATPPSASIQGTIRIVEGSLVDTGTIRILTRGSTDTREDIQTPRKKRGTVYSRGYAGKITDTGVERLPMERAATSLSTASPITLISAALDNDDFVYEFIGQETLGDVLTNHIRMSNSYLSSPRLHHLQGIGRYDVWIDSASGLPLRLAYKEHWRGGNVPPIRMEVKYSDYREVAGYIYPFRVEQLLNGTPWTTITVDSVTLDATVSDSDFDLSNGGM